MLMWQEVYSLGTLVQHTVLMRTRGTHILGGGGDQKGVTVLPQVSDVAVTCHPEHPSCLKPSEVTGFFWSQSWAVW